MSEIEPEQIIIETEETEDKSGQTTVKRRFQIDTEDIVAVFSGIVALIFALGMFFGKIPINKITYGVVGFSAAGTVISRIMKAKNKNKSQSRRKP
jgi:F0F1-type ATP synthase assembly protein I